MPEIEVSRGRALAGAGLLLVVLLLAGRLALGAGAASSDAGDSAVAVAAQPIRAEPAPPLVVHVVGAVRSPGLYRLAGGKRVADAVERAGGATAKADLALINLAAPVADGQQVVVPARAPPAAAGGGAADGAEGAARGSGIASGPVHLNTATLEQLDSLPGVGPVTAQKILQYREEHGAFTSVRELDAIPGIGPARLAQMSELVAP
jgi:competence protein ComEA